MNLDDLEALTRRHVAEIWQDDGDERSRRFLETFGIEADQLAAIAQWHLDDSHIPGGQRGKVAAMSAFIGGALLGLWLGREIETDGLRVEAAYWHEAATAYGRALQAVINDLGGELRIPVSNYGNDSVMLTSEVDGNEVVVRLEEHVNGS